MIKFYGAEIKKHQTAQLLFEPSVKHTLLLTNLAKIKYSHCIKVNEVVTKQ